MAKRQIPTRQIRAKADNGNTYLLLEYTTQISSHEMSGETHWANGTTEWMLEIPGQRRRSVNTDDDVHFTTLEGMTLTKED